MWPSIDKLRYTGGAAPRKSIVGNVLTANAAPPDVSILKQALVIIISYVHDSRKRFHFITRWRIYQFHQKISSSFVRRLPERVARLLFAFQMKFVSSSLLFSPLSLPLPLSLTLPIIFLCIITMLRRARSPSTFPALPTTSLSHASHYELLLLLLHELHRLTKTNEHSQNSLSS